MIGEPESDAQWHYEFNGQTEGPIGSPQLETLVARGDIERDTLVWTEGMADWEPASATPLGRLFNASPAGVAHVPPPRAPRGRNVQPRRAAQLYDPARAPKDVERLKMLTRIACSLLLIFCVLLTLTLVAALTAYYAFDSKNGALYSVAFGAVSFYGVGFLTALSVWIWLYTANMNARNLGAMDLKYSPGGTIGWWFVPFANLVMPYRVVKDIWRGSAELAGGAFTATSPLIGWWWAGYLLMTFMIRIAGSIVEEFSEAEPLFMVVLIALVIAPMYTSAASLIQIMRRVYAMQEEAATHESVLSALQ